MTQQCTNQENGTDYVYQQWRQCLTCNPTPGMGVCMVCAEVCHAGHNLGPIMRTTFFCDCGAGELKPGLKCKCYELTSSERTLDAIKSSESNSCVESQVKLYKAVPVGMTSPDTVWRCLGLAARAFDCSNATASLTAGTDLALLTSQSTPEAKFALGLFGPVVSDENVVDLDVECDSRNTADVVNAYVSRKTNQMIPKLLDGDPHPSAVVCVSALYFNGTWVKPFEEYQTYKNGTFTGRNGTVNIPLMRRWATDKTHYIRTGNLHSIMLPYKGGNYFAVLTLPTSDTDLIESVIAEHGDELTDHLQFKGMRECGGFLRVPKFKREFSYNAFQNNLALAGLDLQALRKASGVDEIIHKVVIDFNELGTEAAAVCGMVSKGMGPPNDFTWTGDRPYNLAIVGNSPAGSTLLFNGIMDFTV